jgi:hypothetical protein
VTGPITSDRVPSPPYSTAKATWAPEPTSPELVAPR